MNSLFGFFDAFFAEVVLGQTSASKPSSDFSSQQRKVGSPTRDDVKQHAIDDKREDQSQKMIRSAPEFDGLNCFETLVLR